MHRRGILLGLLSSWGEFRECRGNFGVDGGCNGEIGCFPRHSSWYPMEGKNISKPAIHILPQSIAASQSCAIDCEEEKPIIKAVGG